AQDNLTLTTDGSLENESGLVYGAQRLSMVTPLLTGEGRLLSAGELSARIDGDHLHQGEMAAGEHLSLTVTGSLDNTGHLTSADEADISATAIHNRTNGEITAERLGLAAGGHLDNAGLVDGGDVRLVSATLDNRPGGRLYGGVFSVTTDRLRNLGDETDAATVAARDSLHLAVDDLENRDEALILSGGDMRIEGHAGTSSSHLLNQGATIEALGDLSIAAKRIDNLNANLVTAQVDEPPVQESWIQLRGSQRTFEATDCSNLYHENVWCSGYPHEISDFTWFRTTAVTSHTEVIESHPATLQAGGDMAIDGGKLLNADSQISAGGTLEAHLDTLDNQATRGQDITRREGTARFTTVESCGLFGSDHCREWHGTSPYRPAPEYGTPYDLPTVTYTDQAGADPSAPTLPGTTGHSSSSMPSLPKSSLFRIRAENPNSPLIETDPRFASYRHWYGSEAMLDALVRDPAYTQKRLGDGFYEQTLVRQQVMEQTGARHLAGFADDETQFRALIDAGIAVGRDLSLAPGVRLSAEQIDRLTTDIVWLEEQRIDVDGDTQHVLVPRLHLADGPTRPEGNSGGIGAENITLAVDDTATNGGHLAASDSLTLSAERIEHLGGSIEAGHTQLTAGTDIHQRGGEIRGSEALTLAAGRDVNIAADTRRGETRVGASHFSRDQVVDPGRLTVNGDGELSVNSGRDIALQAAEISHTGNGATRLAAGRDLQLKTTSVGQDEGISWDADNRLAQGSRRDVGTRIDTRGDIDLLAGRDIALRAGEIDSRSGQVALSAGNDIRLESGRSERHWEEAHRIEDGGLLSSKVRSSLDSSTTDRAVGTTVGGDRVTLRAGENVTVRGSHVISDRDALVAADGDVELRAEHDEQSRQHHHETRRSGFFSNGGLSLTYGKQKISEGDRLSQRTVVPSQLASIDGDVTV
ncbi:MAG: hemagglutinin repeat-containing protein, partial [Guyparkeria sp.]